LLKTFQSETKEYRIREKKLIKVIRALKDHGFPVEDTYEDYVRNDPKRNSCESERISELSPQKPKIPDAFPKDPPVAVKAKPIGHGKMEFDSEGESEEYDKSSQFDFDLDEESFSSSRPVIPSYLSSRHSKRLSDIENVEPQLDSQANSLVSSGLSKPGGSGIPKLTLSSNESGGSRPEFHSEFMSRFEEFSESWRQAIEKEKNRSVN
jgi:hypothetical protein